MRLIDADALWEKMYKYSDNEGAKMPYGDDDSLIHRDSACFLIEEAPTINPEPHWIPVTERLPENGRQVLVYARSVHYALAKYDEMRNADGTYKRQWVTFDAWKPFYTIKEVIAWCELPNLPEPYKGVNT